MANETCPHCGRSDHHPLSLTAYEKACVERALFETGWYVLEAARVLGVGKSTLYRKIEKLGIPLTCPSDIKPIRRSNFS